MRHAIYFALITLTAFFVTPSLAEECGPSPVPPNLPDGASAGPEEMREGMDSAGRFSEASDDYIACLLGMAQEYEDKLNELLKEISSAEEEIDSIIGNVQTLEKERDGLVGEAQAIVEGRNTLVKNWNREAELFRDRLEE